MTKRSIIVIVTLLIGIGIGVIVYNKWNSPERALVETIIDVHKDGMDGLEKHLTDQNIELIKNIQDISEDNAISNLLSAKSTDFIVRFLKSKVSEMDWSVVEITKEEESSEAILGFKYKDMFTGTIGIKMEKVKGKWLISAIGDFSVEEVK
ncbi:hypothetical protein [Jingyaoa shaoxingensis]|uniref:DUF4878 domain-containing protein n=1 Tax=Jingyaoa shaoxingensis TaxID=2763671 RepID=A0ABR7NDC4_9FIRM|nr:hypothetical protein [Jingyaoa shaoxingensis]MBC8574398.1 hypothetical protein [Jingyaoa shaoxingensis]